MRCGLFIYASHHSKAILPWRMISSGSYDDMYDVLCSKVNPGYDIENAVVYDKVGMPMYRLYLIPYEECDVIQWSDEFGTYKGDSRRYVVKSITYDTMGNGQVSLDHINVEDGYYTEDFNKKGVTGICKAHIDIGMFSLDKVWKREQRLKLIGI